MVFSSNELDMLVLQNGEDGISADSKYIWVKYSQNANGVPLTDNPTGAVYIGIAYNKDSIEESNNPDDYSWSKILGDKGEDAYTIILSNENISFSVSYEDNLAIGDQSFTTDVRVFYGATERDDFVIGEIGSSNGITVSKTVNSVTLSVTDSTKITAKHGYFRIPISIDGLIFYKDMSWNTVPQGVPGSVGQSALNVSLGNESQNIPCNSEGVTLESFLIEIPFAAYEGFNKVACTASVGVLPSGITLGQNTGSTPDTDGLIILNVARGSNLGGDEVLQGKVVITFIIGESEVIKNFTWTKTKDGATGEAGQFTLYSLESSAPVISKTFEDTFSPESITFSAYSMEGNSGDKTEYSGMFIIEESTNGTTYDTSYLSSADEQSVTFTPTSINVISIRCTLYKAGGITSALDIYTVPVLTDVDNMRPIIDEITTSISGVESKVDSVEKSITDKVWQTDITTQINNYDNTTTKIIRDRVTQVEQDIDGITSSVSDIESSFNGDIQELTTKISQVEQDANGFKTTVEQSYAKKDDLENEATSIRSEISQTASEINQSISDLEGNTSKISQDLSSLTTRVTNTEGDVTELKQTSSGLETTVKNNSGDIATLKQTAQGLQSDVTTVQADVGKLETSVSQNAKEIELVSSKTEEIGTNLANNYYNKTQTDAKIKVEADKISSTVKTTVTEEISKVEIGGRNLALDSDVVYSGTGYLCAGGYSISPSEGNELSDGNGQLVAGEKYYVSICITPPSDMDYATMFVSSGDRGLIDLHPNGTRKQILSGQFTASYTNGREPSVDPEYAKVAFYRFPDPTSIENPGTCTVHWVKIEKGNKPTDWTPAPEDLATYNDLEDTNEYISGIDERVTTSESEIEQLANSISMMVTDENGQSLMEQTSEGWTFNIGAIQSQVDEATAGLDTVEKNLNSTTDMVNKANDLLDDVTQKTAYINMATDDSGAPCIELGKQGNPFKLRITNTSIDFMQDNMRIAYITNRQLYIEKSVVTDEMKVGSTSGFIWKKRANGNMGLRWVGE